MAKQQHEMTPGDVLQAIAAENAKLPAVDANGYPLGMGYTAPQWITNADGLSVLTTPTPDDN